MVLSCEEVTRAKGYLAARRDMQLDQEAGIAAILRRGRADGSLPRAQPSSDARSLRAAIGQAFEDRMHDDAQVPDDEAVAWLVDFTFRALGFGDCSR